MLWKLKRGFRWCEVRKPGPEPGGSRSSALSCSEAREPKTRARAGPRPRKNVCEGGPARARRIFGLLTSSAGLPIRTNC